VDVDASVGHHEDRMPRHGYTATREAAMAAFAKSWRRELFFRIRCLNLPSTVGLHRAKLGRRIDAQADAPASLTARRCRPNPHA
jgi:hypothetical protein